MKIFIESCVILCMLLIIIFFMLAMLNAAHKPPYRLLTYNATTPTHLKEKEFKDIIEHFNLNYEPKMIIRIENNDHLNGLKYMSKDDEELQKFINYYNEVLR